MTRNSKQNILGLHHLSIAMQKQFLDEFIPTWKGNIVKTGHILAIKIRI